MGLGDDMEAPKVLEIRLIAVAQSIPNPYPYAVSVMSSMEGEGWGIQCNRNIHKWVMHG